MPRAKKSHSDSLHIASGQAVLRIDGQHIYLDENGTPQSHAKYLRMLNEDEVLEHERGGPAVCDIAAPNGWLGRRAISLVLVVRSLGKKFCGPDRLARLVHPLDGLLIDADHRVTLVVGPLVHVQKLSHPGFKRAIAIEHGARRRPPVGSSNTRADGRPRDLC